MAKASDLGGYYKIPSDTLDLNYTKFFSEGEEVITQAHEYHSHNTHRLNQIELEKLLRKLRNSTRFKVD